MKTNIEIISGFLGAGKTTLIKKLIDKGLKNEKIAIIENEFGEVGIDGEIFRKMDIDIKEINSGCICCSLSGDFKTAIAALKKQYNPTRIIIEPSGVAKLSDIIKSCKDIEDIDSVKINSVVTLIDVTNAIMYLNNFGEFYKDQIRNAKIIVLTRVDIADKELIMAVKEKINKLNRSVNIISDNIENIDLEELFNVNRNIKREVNTLKSMNLQVKGKVSEKVKNHSANEFFSTWGKEVAIEYSERELKNILNKLALGKNFGTILRAKGVVKSNRGEHFQFNYVPDQFNLEKIEYDGECKVVVIGKDIDKEKLESLFIK